MAKNKAELVLDWLFDQFVFPLFESNIVKHAEAYYAAKVQAEKDKRAAAAARARARKVK